MSSLMDIPVRRSLPGIVDLRLNNTSQLAGFAKKEGLIFFLKSICMIGSMCLLTPTADMLDAYKKQHVTGMCMKRRFWL